jgi:hypothetical protein
VIRVKDGVEFTVIAPAGFMILEAIKKASATVGVDLTITSACDGEHSGPLDPHHTGEAYDVRTHDLGPTVKAAVLSAITLELGPRFYAFLESPETDNEHLHAQRAKGTTYTVEDFLNADTV